MTSLAIVQIEGVLAKVHTNFNAAKPIDESLPLYEGLKHHWKIAVVSTVATPEEAKAWLKINNFTDYAHLDCRSSVSLGPPAAWLGIDMVSSYRALGWDLGLFVSADPTAVRLALRNGVPGMLMAHPMYMRPEHRPDATREPRAWDTLVEEIHQQQELKSADTRMEAEDVIGGER